MTRDQWIELHELAERHCPAILLDLHCATQQTALGLLVWLRRVEQECGTS